MRSNSSSKKNKKKKNMRRKGTLDWQRLKNSKLMKTGFERSMIDDSYNIEKPINRSVLRRKRSLAEFYQSST